MRRLLILLLLCLSLIPLRKDDDIVPGEFEVKNNCSINYFTSDSLERINV